MNTPWKTKTKSLMSTKAGVEMQRLTDAQIEDGKFRMDDSTTVYLAPTAIPFELAPTGSVFKGFNNLDKAKEYAESAADFFAEHSLQTPVFVVHGPTSTTASKFEVVTATCGYSIVHRTARRDLEEAQQHERPRG